MSRFAKNPVLRHIPVILAVIIGCALSALAFQVAKVHEIDRIEARLKEVVSNRVHLVERRIESNKEVLRSIVAFYEGSKFVDRQEFRIFVRSALGRYPSIQALEWIARVPAAERADYEKAAREDGLSAFQIMERTAQRQAVPAGERDEYFPVYYVEPHAGNEAALGFDLASNPARREALEASRDGGGFVASSAIKLVQDEGIKLGLLVFAPVYRNGYPHETTEQRRENLAGFALAVFRIGEMMDAAFLGRFDQQPGGGEGLDIHVYDDTNPELRRLLYRSHSHLSVASASYPPQSHEDVDFDHLLLARSLEVGGRTWTIEARANDTVLSGLSNWEPWGFLAGGMAFTVLLAAYLLLSGNRTRGVERLVEERTKELTKTSEQLKGFFDVSIELLCIADFDGYFRKLNPAWQNRFGYTAKQLFTKPFLEFAHPDDRQATEMEVQKLATGDHVTVQFENRYRCEDGSYRWLTWHATADPEAQLIYAAAHDITERKEISQMKNEFISTVSHELRTPLTSINGSLGLLAEGVTGTLPEKADELVGIARNNCDRLIRLINDILDIEKIESGRMDYHIGVLDIGALVTQAIEANQAFASQFDVFFTVEDRAAGATVQADSDRLLQVLTNLLSNAAKFSPVGDQVSITITRRNEQIRVTVTDNGLGIPPKFRTHIFEKFAQADSSDRRRKGGTGLGLAICRQIMEQLDGRIDFRTALGEGTSFFFELPEWRGTTNEDLPPEASENLGI